MSDTTTTGSVLDKFFDAETMSVHIQQGQPVVAKKGAPGKRKLVPIADPISREDVNQLLASLQTELENFDDAFLEIERKHSTVYQLGQYRVVVVRPPVSTSIELTIVKQIKQISLDDYDLPDEVHDRLLKEARGILIAGAPGEGKSTFAQAFVHELAEQNVVIKTLESPRDLIVPKQVTQYSFTHASHSELRDILLLSRPDYTIYDEVRNRDDFVLYKDLRLTGVGLVGVMHATQPIDAVQRFMGSVDMGSIPQVIDTIVYIEAGQVKQILTLELTVKTPEGMESEDLARPVIFVKDLLEDKLLYEIYNYGESVVVMPVELIPESAKSKQTGVKKYAKIFLEEELSAMLQCKIQVEVLSMQAINLYVPEREIGRIIGKKGQHIDELEKMLGLTIHVKTASELPQESTIPFEIEKVKKGNKTAIEIQLPKGFEQRDVDVLIGDKNMTLTTDTNGTITIRKKKLIKPIEQGDFHVIG